MSGEELKAAAWLYERNGSKYVTANRQEHWTKTGSAETPLYAHPLPQEGVREKAREAAVKLADMPVKGLRVGEKPYVMLHALDRDALVDLLAAVAHPLPEQPQEGEHIADAGKMVAALTSELATVKKRLESAEDALRPFAMALHEWGDDAGQPDRWNVWEHPIANGVTLGDFRSAAHFLQEQEKQNG